MNNCNIFLAPRPNEGVGVSALEQYARGCIIAGRSDSYLPSFITHGENGIFIDKDLRDIDLGRISRNVFNDNKIKRNIYIQDITRFKKDILDIC
jgi:glycosyltransferase involved in cell wall biosynthesis